MTRRSNTAARAASACCVLQQLRVHRCLLQCVAYFSNYVRTKVNFFQDTAVPVRQPQAAVGSTDGVEN